jgi:radical SAM superfamily enzyme YgiQ (UPF0313 family)
VLKQDGHDTALLHITTDIHQDDFIARVRSAAPDLVAYSATSHMFPLVKRYSRWLVEAGVQIPAICGGIHATIAPDEVISEPGIDMICRGEGEDALREVCESMQLDHDATSIQNLWVKRNGDIARNPIRPLIQNLDQLPFPDRSIFDYENLYAEREGRGSFMVARGCPYDCTYCCNHLVRKINDNTSGKVRYRSVDHVISEIQQVLRTYPFITRLIFDDDILFLNRKWSEEFAARYPAEVGLPFGCNARANLVDAPMMALLKRAGCYLIKFGVESGSETIVNDVLRRHLTNDDIRRAFALSREAGLTTESFNMVGIPYETPARILQTVKINAEVKVDQIQVTIYQPYQGTQLTELCRREGFLRSPTPADLETDFFSPSEVRLDTLSPAQTLMFRNYFKILVRFYRVLFALPAPVSTVITRTSDALLKWRPAAPVLNACYVPLNRVFRRGQYLKTTFVVWRRRKRGRKQRPLPVAVS